MSRPRHKWFAAVAGALMAVGLLGAALAQQPAVTGVPVVTDLTGPRGLSALTGGDFLVAEGAGGRLLRAAPDGTTTELATGLPVIQLELAPGEVETVGISSAISDGNGGYLFVVGESTEPGFSALYALPAGGEVTLVADLGDYEEANNTDGDVDLAGDPEFLSNPYDLVSDGDGGLFVTDSGANTVLHLDADYNITAYAVFTNRENPLFPNIGGPTMDQVPTGITIGPDGALYVSTLTGFPFPTGAARVYRLEDLNADGDALDDGESTIFAEGLTAATDVLFDSDGTLLVSEFSTNMLANAPGRISRFVDGERTTLVHVLVTPTSMAITEAGRLLVTQEFIGMVTDVTDVPSGGFTPAAGPGATLASYGGGSVAQLEAELLEIGATSAAATVDGSFVVLIVGAPAFVNAEFNAAFASGFSADTPMLVTNTS